MSEFKHSTLAEALVAAQSEFGVIAKDTANPFFKSKYADLPAVMREAQPVLAKHGLAVSQQPSYVNADGKVYDTLKTVVIHESGEQISSTMVLHPVKNDPQAHGSAITYARRYAYMAALGLVADVDDDGNAASAKAAPRKAAPKKTTNPEAAEALERVKAAAKAAGVASKDVQVWFAEQYPDGGAVVSSTDVDALTATATHFELLASA
ncbi:ERF family protein [Mycobacteroides abscessus]|uniref:ERF family protein n=1 Tax=Mycobacteroides abscessus TaxID=36809 RepID=UPI0005E2A63A|nr:ERF family protein [Mycobacteroides abscessus]MDB2213882.1 ERF family protein [Mycobacteroides abscessus subsp. massiliense]WJJ55474.1 ssDNA binding protein, ERF family [Mycobacterium phage prophiT49-2]CPS10200.1 ERF superfamily [Mycobacteroides abscessus]CPU99338.1 ERF superfamily [Mycobacteroides abscessus]